jgi:hypothetical protein
MMEKYGDKADSRAEKLYGLEAAKANTMADIQLKQDKLKQDRELGFAQISATRAGQFNLGKEIADSRLQQGIEAYKAQYGKAPTGKDLANLRAEASVFAAEKVKVDPFGAPKLNVAVENAVSTRLGKDSVYKDLSLALLTADPKDKPAIQARMDARESQIRSEVQTNAGAGGTTQPSAGAAQGAPMPTSKADLQKGQVYNTSRGPARWNGTAFEAI